MAKKGIWSMIFFTKSSLFESRGPENIASAGLNSGGMKAFSLSGQSVGIAQNVCGLLYKPWSAECQRTDHSLRKQMETFILIFGFIFDFLLSAVTSVDFMSELPLPNMSKSIVTSSPCCAVVCQWMREEVLTREAPSCLNCPTIMLLWLHLSKQLATE